MTVQHVLPRWRGFNLLEMFSATAAAKSATDAYAFIEDDFRWITDWGFDFVRLPMNYRLWLVDDDPFTVNEAIITHIDGAIQLADKYNTHICLNFHTAPGYRIGLTDVPPGNLWKNQMALDAFCFQWQFFARRYKGIDSSRLSFDLVNEPPPVSDEMSYEDFIRVNTAAVNAIRAADPDRLIIADGHDVGTKPCPELAALKIGQSCRGYAPMGVSHYLAPWWPPGMTFPPPHWPEIAQGNITDPWDRARLEQFYQPWADLAQQGVGVHCGEFGCYIQTPHDVALAWLGDVLDIITGHGIGWALWNLRGNFGILDSNRKDVAYTDWYGHQLDTKMLYLLEKH